MPKTEYSASQYDNIWKPYRIYINRFVCNNPKGLRSFLKLSKLIGACENILNDKTLRNVDLDAVDWEGLEDRFWIKSRYVSRYFGGQHYYIPETGNRMHWMGFILANVAFGNYEKPKTYIELGSGIGENLFDIHALSLNDDNRYYGADYSENAVESADAVFSLLTSEKTYPFWKFIHSNISDLPIGVFDAGGQDVVILTVSVINKIPELSEDFFNKVKSWIVNARKIEMIMIESVGWQIYMDKGLLGKYKALGERFQNNDSLDLKTIEGQRAKNLNQGSNTNFMNILMESHHRTEVGIKFVMMNTFSHHPYEPYSVFRVQIQ